MRNQEDICQYSMKQRAITTISLEFLLKSDVAKVILLTNCI